MSNAFEGLTQYSLEQSEEQQKGLARGAPIGERKTFTDFYGDNLKKIATASDIIWKCGNTFRHACDISVLYVQGILVSSPYHFGPILCESGPIAEHLTNCTRNGLLTTSSEPAQKTTPSEFNDWEDEIKTAAVGFWVQHHNVPTLMKTLDKYKITNIRRTDVDGDKVLYKFSDEFGSNYHVSDAECYFVVFEGIDIRESNGLFDILVEASRSFTDDSVALSLPSTPERQTVDDSDEDSPQSSPRTSQPSSLSSSRKSPVRSPVRSPQASPRMGPQSAARSPRSSEKSPQSVPRR
jgi:hypothetical protein